MVPMLPNGLFFSEFLADNAGGSAFDTDGDGGANKADEFVEIQSNAGSTLSLDGIQLWSAKRGLLFAFPSGNSVAPGATATVVGQYDGAEPPGFFDAGLPDNNTNQGFLEDGEGSRFDTLYLVDTNTGAYIELLYGDPPQAQSLPSGFPGTTLAGSESVNSNAPNGTPIARNADGDLVETSTPDPGTSGPVCFARGTLIRTDKGERAIETLRPGDLIWTFDRGYQSLRWVGKYEVTAGTFDKKVDYRPIRIRAGALGKGRPARDLVVSPQHRMLVQSPVAARMIDKAGVLIPAKKLLDLPGVEVIEDCAHVIYYHILLPHHEIVLSNGTPSETMLLGPMALRAVGAQARAEISRMFPEVCSYRCHPFSARRIGKGRRMARLVARHIKNGRPLLESFRLA